MRTLILLGLWTSLLNASNLTVCGISDGGAGDTDGVVNGSISAQCSSSGGLFSGTVTESAAPMTYRVMVSGTYQGSGGVDITGTYDIAPGIGDFYPFIRGGMLASLTPGGLVEPGAFVRFGDAIAYPGPQVGTPLPAPMRGSFGSGTFNIPITPGPHAYSIGLSWFAGGPDHYFDYHPGIVLQVSTAPDRVIPEPSMAPLMGAALLALLARAKWRS